MPMIFLVLLFLPYHLLLTLAPGLCAVIEISHSINCQSAYGTSRQVLIVRLLAYSKPLLKYLCSDRRGRLCAL